MQYFEHNSAHIMNSLRVDPTVAVADIILSATFTGTPVAGSSQTQPGGSFFPQNPAVAPTPQPPAGKILSYPGSAGAFLVLRRILGIDNSTSTTYTARIDYLSNWNNPYPLAVASQGALINQTDINLVVPELITDPGAAAGYLRMWFYTASGTALDMNIWVECSILYLFAQ